ncbi:MAG TPA: site-specific DNA-methyltransferase [Bacillus sp. (in: Bacteria)]|nr:site-specific DNA-methyltransferase [Bacillus sp. (in: firmicutes)]
MNQKRDEISQFLNNDLVPQVKKAFEKYKNADLETIKQQLAELERQLNDMGVAKESSEKYSTLKGKLNHTVDITALENEVFSDLTNFFRRYYHNGDFLSLRRYKKDVYAIPYEGEEVKLHWANADQYYVKSSEYFRDYTFKLPSEKTVHFKLVEANTEQNNNMEQEGKERRFILFEEQPLKEECGELYIHFEYRPAEGKQTQKQLNESALEYLLTLADYTEWIKELQTVSPTEKNKKRTLLEKYLNDYTARNTFDYFIHKDLGGFLRRELDFFIKNEVMHLDDLDTENEKRFEQYLSKVKVIKSIGHKVIAFLEQIENFQKKLWLKKKFIVETNYCITIDKIPEEFYEEIRKNEPQIDEWIKLFVIDELDDFTNPLSNEFLLKNPSLILDTKFFDKNFNDKLLSQIDNIDDNINGLLIHSENFQALNLLQNRYEGEIDGIHIDPPYNTETSGFLYKNNYKHSSWASMMYDRIKVSDNLLDKGEGSYLCHIDENEYELLFNLYQLNNIPNAGTIVWDKLNPMLGRKGVATQHEYIIYRTYENSSIYAKSDSIPMMLEKAEEAISKHSGVNELSRKEYADWVSKNKKLSGGDKAYKYLDEAGQIYRLVAMGAPERRTDSKYFIPLIHPETQKPCPIPNNGWSRTPETMKKMIEEGTIIFGKDDSTQPQKKVTLTANTKRQLSSIIADGKSGKAYLDKLGFTFPYVHPVSLYEKLLSSNDMNMILDFFAGSGTTGHAVINLNREDNGNRKYILIEMGEYFETVLKPRIMKVIYSKEWKDGKPLSREGSSHIFKYLKLESYEDVLNNIQLSRSPQQQAAIDEVMSSDAREEYLLSYMLDVEAEGSSSILNIEAFNNPFDYKMMITKDTESKPTKVDLIETFNYLIGLHVRTIDMIKGVKVITGKLRTGEEVLILWRNINEVSNEQFEDFFMKQGYNTRDSEFDRIYVNGDNHLENLRLAENKWKIVLIEEEFKRLMFDVQGM